MANRRKLPRGGHGGSVEVFGDAGKAEGGNGGRGGAKGFGRGGDGGGGTLHGSGYARGGDGGDAGRPERPALGAASTLSYVDDSWLSVPGMTDRYGIPQPGKGGDSYTAYVTHDGYRYCLNILLQLLRGPIPEVVENREIIDTIDAIALSANISSEQEWWNLAVQYFPKETAAVMAHVRRCEKG